MRPEDLSVGTKVFVTVPKDLPDWMGPAWKAYVRYYDKTIRTVTKLPFKGIIFLEDHCPIEAHEKLYVTLVGCISAFPIEWLSPMKIPCDCSTQRLLTRGCQIPDHV